MSNPSMLELCACWNQTCMQYKCVSYEVHTKQRFRNMKTGAWIPYDQLNFYSGLSQDELNVTVERLVTITHECKQYAKILQIEQTSDHFIPRT